MESIVRFWLKCIFLCVLFLNSEPTLLRAQTFSEADKASLLELEWKLMYEAESAQKQLDIVLAQAELLMQHEAYAMAAKKLETVNLGALSVADVNKALTLKIECYYLQSDYNNALRNAKLLEHLNGNDSLLVREAILLQLLCYNNLLQWNEAEMLLHNNSKLLFGNDTVALCRFVDETYNQSPKIKNPDKAQLLSHILPGAGQFYAGKIGEGLLSFSLQAAVLGLTGYGIYKQYYITSYLAGFGVFQKFYFGGGTRASFLTKQRNEKVASDFNTKVNKKLTELVIN